MSSGDLLRSIHWTALICIPNRAGWRRRRRTAEHNTAPPPFPRWRQCQGHYSACGVVVSHLHPAVQRRKVSCAAPYGAPSLSLPAACCPVSGDGGRGDRGQGGRGSRCLLRHNQTIGSASCHTTCFCSMFVRWRPQRISRVSHWSLGTYVARLRVSNGTFYLVQRAHCSYVHASQISRKTGRDA